MAAMFPALRTGRTLLPRNIFLFLVLISAKDLVRPEGLGKLKEIHLIRSRTRDLPACSIAS
jgi:hypothetical protein